jgi:hypothetical protein
MMAHNAWRTWVHYSICQTLLVRHAEELRRRAALKNVTNQKEPTLPTAGT